MKIVDAEHILGGERIVFYFMSDSRIDFRDLVKHIAHEYQTRIEMRQIGSRDEAKLLGDIESCGQECCCKRFLRVLQPVNMRMAKMQKATLDPAKISGYCGRLKCCLRYEDNTYTELKKRLPKRNAWVTTKDGQGRVVDTQILTQLVVVEYDGGTRSAWPVEEIKVVAQNRPPADKNQAGADKENDSGEDKRNATEQNGGKDRRRSRNKRSGNERRSGDNSEQDDGQENKPDAAEKQKQDAAETVNQQDAAEDNQ
jgi:hypothetical protein